MTRTANATEKMKRESLIAAAARQGNPILCAICGKPILLGQRVAYDHGHAVGRDGPNEVANLFPVHDEKGATLNLDCHTRKTCHPRGPHTAIGGDTHEAAKTKRLEAMTQQDHAIRHGLTVRPSSAMRSRPMQSRVNAWPPRGSRPMNRKRSA